MKVFAFLHIPEHPDSKSSGGQKNDIVFLWPIRPKDKLGKLTLDVYLPVVIDATIPCGTKYFKSITTAQVCNNCQHNDPDDCDHVKYSKALWGTGTIDDPPKPIKKHRYSMDRSAFISGLTEAIIVKPEKTEAEKELIVSQSISNTQDMSLITDKIVTR